jgi:hypothetical protein
MTLRLIEDFFEVGANPENTSGSGWSVNGGRVSGSGAMVSTSAAVFVATTGQGWDSAMAECYCGFALKTDANISGTSIISFYGDSNSTQHITLTTEATNNYLQVRLGSASGTVLATSATPFPTLNQWRSINMYVKIHDTTGRVVVKVDGVTQIDFTGDTKNGGTNTTIDGIRLAMSSGANRAISDLVVCDGLGTINNTYPGDISVIRRLPNANGTYSDFTGSDGNSTDNYLLVDDSPTDTADYVYAASSGLKDSYGVEDLPLSATSVLGVRAVAKCAKSGAGSAGMSVFVREGSTDTFGPDVPLSTSFSWQGDTIRETAPSTGVAWTISGVNAMEIGVRSEAS